MSRTESKPAATRLLPCHSLYGRRPCPNNHPNFPFPFTLRALARGMPQFAGRVTIHMEALALAFCEGCDIVQSDHAPQAGVAQGFFNGDLIRRRVGHQEELEEELDEEVERRVRRDHMHG